MPFDIRVLMVTDGTRFNFGPPQPTTSSDPDYFGLTTLVTALTSSATPTISVTTAHRRRSAIVAEYPTVAPYIDYPEDFSFTGTLANPVDLADYDVLFLVGDEGINGGPPVEPTDAKLTQGEVVAIATFMQNGGGVFAVGDHDGIGSYMCRRLPRLRTMRKWSYTSDTDPDAGPDSTGQKFVGNWSALGSATSGPNDRFDTLRADSGDGLYYFEDQSDQTPQPVLTKSGAPLTGSTTVHALLRGITGAVIGSFPDHMHEGEATDFSAVMPGSTPFDPNDGSGNPTKFALPDGTLATFDEFPRVDGVQPVPEVIAYGSDLGHASLDPSVGATNPKTRGIVSVYDGRAANVGRIATGSTFHHYLDKNLIGDPMTANTSGTGAGPTGTNTGLLPATLEPIEQYYVNLVTWLARPNASFYFLTNKNVFGLDEVETAATQHQTFGNAFYLVFDGLSAGAIGSSPSIQLSGPFANGLGYQRGAPIVSGGRVLVPFTITSIPSAAFPAPTTSTQLTLEASVTVGGVFYAAETLFELGGGADPYFTNIDPGADNVFYLSQDLRVFTANPGSTAPFVPFPSGQPHTYITNLLAFLNTDASFTSSSTGMDPFTTLNAANDLHEDTSVDPSKSFFAIAKVRLRPGGTTQPTVRVFFRLFATQSNDTDFAPTTTYLSTYDAAGLPATPLRGAQGSTFPMFASGSASGDYPGPNTASLTIPSTGESWAYFGCFLDFSVSPPLPGTHHCLVAQIAYDGAPIVDSTGITLSPENSDKLAQRNLQITSSGNPGGPAAHRVPQTFDTRTSVRSPASLATIAGYPDELVIDWGDVPRGTKASIYWPDASAADVVRLAMFLYASEAPTIVDAHTISCVVSSRLTYLPIPFGQGGKLAGLFTIDLPQGVRAGQQFHVVVRRVSTRTRDDVVIEERVDAKPAISTGRRTTRDWRYVVGSFQVTIPVAVEETLLSAEETTLSIMKWRLLQTPPSSRWHLVLTRYVSYLTARVNAFGGNAGGIVPSPIGAQPGHPKGGGSGHHLEHHQGKVCEVFFDCFGELEGFLLDTCTDEIRFHAHERAVADLLLRACRERLTLKVFVDPAHPRKVCRLAVLA